MSFLDAIWSVFNYQVPINVAPLYSKNYAANHMVPFWLLVATFAILFAVVWVASQNIPLFKKVGDKDPNKGPRSVFAIAVSIVALFGTPLAIWIMWIVYTFTLLSIIAVVIVAGYLLWTITKGSIAENAKTNAASNVILAEAKKSNADTTRKNEQTKAYKVATKDAAEKGLRFQLGILARMKKGMKSILTDFYKIKKDNKYPVSSHQLNNLLKKSSVLNADFANLGKLTTFTVPNDRSLSLMSTASYDEKNMNTTGLNTTTNLASLKAAVESQSSDFGHSLSAIRDTLQKGIIDEPTATNLINWSESSINILSRMERDIVLEKQQIEKLV